MVDTFVSVKKRNIGKMQDILCLIQVNPFYSPMWEACQVLAGQTKLYVLDLSQNQKGTFYTERGLTWLVHHGDISSKKCLYSAEDILNLEGG